MRLAPGIDRRLIAPVGPRFRRVTDRDTPPNQRAGQVLSSPLLRGLASANQRVFPICDLGEPPDRRVLKASVPLKVVAGCSILDRDVLSWPQS
jgi:hypothetical protein